MTSSPSQFAHRRSGLYRRQIVASAFATDGDDGKSKRRGGNGRLMTATFQIVVSKADRDGSGRKLARILAP
jgi:hypothetical protein